MSQSATLAALATVLQGITTPSAPAKVYANPREATGLGEFPCIVLTVAPGASHTWNKTTMGNGTGNTIWSHYWTAGLYLFVGQRGTPLPELHGRILGWPESITAALNADLTLGHVVSTLGTGQPSQPIWSYQVGPIQWADGLYFGIKGQIGVREQVQP